jgi:hypothetical protein
MRTGGPREPRRPPHGDYMRFMGMGLTMAGIVVVCTLAGWWLDARLTWRFPVCTLGGALLGITGALLHLFKETGRQ